MKIIRSFLAIFLVTATMTATLSALAAGGSGVQITDLSQTMEVSFVSGEDNAATCSPVDLPTGAVSATVISAEEAAAFLRSQMEQRVCDITINWSGYWFESNSQLSEEWRSILYGALAHTGVPTQGDYIMRHYGSTQGQITYDPSTETATFSFSIVYDTTMEQEAIVGERISELFAQWDSAFGFYSQSDYEKIYAIYDYICGNVSYDYEHLNNGDYPLKYTAYAALINGTATEQGYSNLFYRMALEAGIDSRIIPGYGGGSYHIWNIVKIGGQYYCVDPTWDAGTVEWQYFLRGTDRFYLDHTPDADFSSDEFCREYPVSFANYNPTVITLDQTALTLEVDEEAFLHATVAPGYSNDVYWVSSDTSVVTVQRGRVFATGSGSAVVSVVAANGEYSASCLVTVTNATYLAKVIRTDSDFSWFEAFGLGTYTVDGSYTVGDYWLVSYNEADMSLTPFAQPETFTGRQTYIWWNAAKHTIDGIVYEDSPHYALDEAGYYKSYAYTWFLDHKGRVIGSIQSEPIYAVVLGAQWINQIGENGYALATVFYLDSGTYETVRIASVNGYAVSYAGTHAAEADFSRGMISTTYQYNTDTANTLYTAFETEDGLELLAVTTDLDMDIHSGVPALGDRGYYADNDTTFFFYNAKTGEIDTVVGFDNLPAQDGYRCRMVDIVYDLDGSVFAKYVYIPHYTAINNPYGESYTYLTDDAYVYELGDRFAVLGVIDGNGNTDPLYFSKDFAGSEEATEAWLNTFVKFGINKLFGVTRSEDGLVLDLLPVPLDEGTVGSRYISAGDYYLDTGVLVLNDGTALNINQIISNGAIGSVEDLLSGDSNLYVVGNGTFAATIFLTPTNTDAIDGLIWNLTAIDFEDVTASFTYSVNADTEVKRALIETAVRNSCAVTLLEGLSTWCGVDVTICDIRMINDLVALVQVEIGNGVVGKTVEIAVVFEKIIAHGTCGDALTWELTEDGVLTIEGEGAMWDYEYDYYDYGDHFDNCSTAPWQQCRDSITSVVIGDSVTTIGDYAFAYCPVLTSVVIGDGVTSIGNCAFLSCTSLTEIVIPDSVTNIDVDAFYDCPALATVHFKGNRTQWAALWNFGNDALYSANIVFYQPDFGICGDALTWTLSLDGVLTIEGEGAMWDYTNIDISVAPWRQHWEIITSVVIGDGVTSIGSYAFFNCTALTGVVIGDSVTTIGDSAFRDCDALTSIMIPDSVTSIGGYAFYSCTVLTDVVIGDGVTTIGDHAFAGCYALTSVVIGDGVTGIARSAFASCYALTSVVMGDSVTIIENYAFQNCDALTSIVLPDSMTTICARAFEYCDVLTEIEIPNSVTTIENNAFNSCPALTTVHYKGNRTQWVALRSNIGYSGNDALRNANIVFYQIDSGTCGDNIDWVLDLNGVLTLTGEGRMYDNDGWEALWSPIREYILQVVIDDGIKTIGAQAFSGCENLVSIEIPDSVRTIGDYAFQSCTVLAEIEIPDSVTTIGYAAFASCHNLQTIEIPDSVTTIGDNAFMHCSRLTSVVIPDSVTSIGYAAFANCYNLQAVVIPDSVTSIGGHAFISCMSLTEIVIPDSIKTIGEYAFHNCTSLANVTLGSGLKSLGMDVFSECVSLSVIEIPDSVTSLGEYAFRNCTGLETVVIGGGVDTIYASVFAGCTNLTDITIGEGVNTIGASAFADCTSLSTVTIGEGVKNIGEQAFAGCVNLSVIEIPDSVTNLGAYAFSNCTGLTAIVISDGLTEIREGTFSGCIALEYVLFGNNLQTIGKEAFLDCSALAEIVLPESMKTVGESAFYYCSGLIYADLGGTQTIAMHAFRSCDSLTDLVISEHLASVGRYAFRGCSSLARVDYAGSMKQWERLQANIGSKNDELLNAELICNLAVGTCGAENDGSNLTWKLTVDGVLTISGRGAMADYDLSTPVPWAEYAQLIRWVIVNSGATSIGDYAFYGCESMESITLPEGLDSIGEGAFRGCEMLTDIEVDAGNERYIVLDGVLFTADLTTLICYPAGKTGAAYTIPNSVEIIEAFAFAGCKELAEITIGGNMAEIRSFAFDDCSSLTTVFYRGSTEQWRSLAIYDGNDALLNAEILIDSGTCGIGANLIWKLTADGVLTITGEGAMMDYSSGGTPWNSYSAQIFSIVIGDGVTNIGAEAFRGCSSLTSVLIGNGAVTVGSKAFFGCRSLTSVAFGSNVTDIGAEAFTDCRKLAYIALPNSVSTIGRSAFSGCTGLQSIEIPESVTGIESYAFSGCTSLKSIMIPEGVTEIASNLFYGCTALEQISVPESVTGIGMYAFYNCANLAEIAIPNGVTAIGEYAFSGCVRLAHIVIPEGMTNIESDVFSGCTGLRSITLPASMETICDYAFSGCTGLATVYYPGNAAQWNAVACGEGNQALLYAEFLLSSGICGAVGNGENLTWKLTIDGVLTISGEGAMADWGSLNAPWSAYYSVVTSVVIDSGVTTIGACAFYNCIGLTSVAIPGNVTTIGSSAFYNCIALESVVLSEGVKTIGRSAFHACTALKNIVIPFGVTTIESSAFTSCSALTSVEIPGSVTEIGICAFYNCTALESVEIGEGVTTIEGFAFHTCTALKNLVIPDSVTTISSTAFQNCTALENAEIGAGWSNINVSVFAGCSSLVSITVDEDNPNCCSVNGVLFDKNKTVLICYPAGRTEGAYVIPDSVTAIGDEAFHSCAALTSVEIGEGVTTIGDNAFYSCTALTTVYYHGTETQWSAITVGTNNDSLLNAEIVFNYGKVLLEGLNKDEDGVWRYYENGELATGFTGFVKHVNGKYYFVDKGVVEKSTGLVLHVNGKYYYIQNGVKSDLTGFIKHTDGKYYYVKNGVKSDTNGFLKHTNGKYYYVQNGMMVDTTGLVKHTNGKYYYIVKGVKQDDFIGLVKHTNKKFYYVENGVWTKVTALVPHTNGKLYYVVDGIHDDTYNGTAKDLNGKEYKVVKGIAQP